MMSPSVLLLLGWMLVPLTMTIYFSFLRYNLLNPGTESFTGWTNYYYFVTDPSFTDALVNTISILAVFYLLQLLVGLHFHYY